MRFKLLTVTFPLPQPEGTRLVHRTRIVEFDGFSATWCPMDTPSHCVFPVSLSRAEVRDRIIPSMLDSSSPSIEAQVLRFFHFPMHIHTKRYRLRIGNPATLAGHFYTGTSRITCG